MTSSRKLLLILFFLIFSSRAVAFDFKLQNTIQGGLEFDSNIFKTYNARRSDGLFRALYKSDINFKWPSFNIGIIYRLGGKKFFTRSEQDTVINLFEISIAKKLSKKISLALNTHIKYQAENSDLDSSGLDVNEDFIAFDQALSVRLDLVPGLLLLTSAKFNYFDFNNSFPSLSYYHQKYSLTVFKNITASTQGGMDYSYNRYNFKNIARTDALNDVSWILKYTGSIYLNLSYSLQFNSSNDSTLDFTNHRVSIIASMPVKFSKNHSKSNLNPDFVVSLIGILRFKNYANQIVVDEEGRRYLLSESEEDNFNIIVLKLTKDLSKNSVIELKFTRHSNEFASTGQNFARYSTYLGLRFTL